MFVDLPQVSHNSTELTSGNDGKRANTGNMNIQAEIWNSPREFLATRQPDHPVHFFAPSILQAQATRFQRGFTGLVSFAVKSNPYPIVISNLLAAGVEAFDVASPNEIRLIRELAPYAAMHYNNPVRSRSEIQFAYEMGVRSFAVDGLREFDKLQEIVPPEDVEISVRFKLPVSGAIYDFGSKFGATPDKAAALLQQVAAAGYIPSITFHPGTQCEDPSAWHAYITQAAAIARNAQVTLKRLNVGGGFPCKMDGEAPNLEVFFALITNTAAAVFDVAPELVCEPGRAMVAESFAHAVRIKGINDQGAVFLNDGIYGGLSEFPVLAVDREFAIYSPQGVKRNGRAQPQKVFGPTCDSLDVLPNPLPIPTDTKEDDYILFQSMGAYVKGVTTDFNGYGQMETVTTLALM